MAKSPAQIIDDKGGPAEFAGRVGKRPGTVRQWKLRNRLPRSAWPEILVAFPELTMDHLKAAERKAA